MSILLATLLSPFFVDFTPEVRSTYISLGKLLEDRPMQITNLRAGWASETFGEIGVRDQEVSSLTDRRADAHRHTIYHSEYGPMWKYGIQICDGWKIVSEITRSWTVYRGFKKDSSNRTFHWYQFDQSLENPYLVPFYRVRRTFRGNEYLYVKGGVRHKFALPWDFSLTPSVFAEGGNGRYLKRNYGKTVDDGSWDHGASSVSFRLELAYTPMKDVSLFAFVEQFEVVNETGREANRKTSYNECGHNDWTHGGVGVRIRF